MTPVTPLDRRVARVLDRCAPWLQRPATLLVAVSGGPDSTALMHALAATARGTSLTLVVAHVDHGLRASSAAEAAQVRALATAAGLRCLVLRGGPRIAAQGPLGRAGGLEQVAREARYRLLARAARRTGAAAIAVAHTLDDQAETVLLRLLRGAGPTGLGGMRPVARMYGARLVRPLLGASRQEVLESLALRGVTALTDDSNTDATRERNWLRHDILPQLAARWGDTLPRRIARAARLARDAAREERHAARAAYALLATVAPAPSPRAITLDAPRLASYSRAVQRSVVRHALREMAGTLTGFSLAHVSRILALAVPPSARSPRGIARPTDLPHGLRVTVRGTTIVLAERAPRDRPAG